MRRSGITIVTAALILVLVGAAVATAHWNRQEGGPNGDVLDGHDHTDRQFGRGGCDVLLGRDGQDEGFGGDQGCDDVRGMEGGADAAIVCDDNAGNDYAAGGGGPNDYCFGGYFDNADFASCEFAVPTGNNCA